MTVGEVITKHFMEFSGLVRNQDIVIENSLTSEDIFTDAIITALKKYRTSQVDEIECFEYIKKTILMEYRFCRKRIKNDKLVFCESLPDIPYRDTNMEYS